VRWRKVFPGRDDQVRQVRRFVAELLADHPGCDDIVLCAAELATNAIRHTASGRDGFFATEVSWTAGAVRIAIADGGAPTAPFSRQPGPNVLGEAHRGLDAVAQMSVSCGAEGDSRGRVVWAEFPPATETAPTANGLPLAPEPATDADAAALAGRYAAWHTWFGYWTRQWWALSRQPSGPAVLIAEPTAAALARHLDALQSNPSGRQLKATTQVTPLPRG
jgi:serine/threonine-protein kinase RsbW